VSHRYAEAHYYSGHRVVVVGAGSSAAELALELFRSQCEVTVAMREERFQTKYWVEPDIENRIQEGSITAHRNVDVVEITPEEALVEDRASGERTALPCDFVLAMTGYEPDTTLIENAGAEVDHDTGKPILNERLESTVPGLYVAGTLCAGYEANVVFVENGREHGPLIVNDILAQRGRG
jgi:thioredoxin reductase (NADPH)